jgi:hypothetical protein
MLLPDEIKADSSARLWSGAKTDMRARRFHFRSDNGCFLDFLATVHDTMSYNIDF